MVLCFASGKRRLSEAISIAGSGRGHDLGASAGQMAAVAELEAGLISSRTKAALAAAKARGKKLGGNRGVKLTAKARAAGRAVVAKRATARAADLAPIIAEIRAAGIDSLRGISAVLNERGISQNSHAQELASPRQRAIKGRTEAAQSQLCGPSREVRGDRRQRQRTEH